MRTLTLSKSGFNKIRSQQNELKAADIQDSLKPLPPGEWCHLVAEEHRWLAFVNPLVGEKNTAVHVLAGAPVAPETFIRSRLEAAVKRRRQFRGYESGARLFFGSSDGLPGLIIDQFRNAILVQINTAGVDRYRDLVAATLNELLKIDVYFLDNPKYREKEFLPQYEGKLVPGLSVEENELVYELRSEVIQKVGFYYDHRENRLALRAIVSRLTKTYETGLDLFCYAGAWGMNALKAGVRHVDFVDQGDFQAEVETGLQGNSFTNRGSFRRQDVFKFLDEAIAAGRNYDLIMCDPPAFAKSLQQKDQALDGYSKLHRKVLRLVSPGGLVVFSSCTHYVSHDEFQKNVTDAARKEGRSLQLLHCGVQGWDHPISSQNEKSNYIKSYFYISEPL